MSLKITPTDVAWSLRPPKRPKIVYYLTLHVLLVLAVLTALDVMTLFNALIPIFGLPPSANIYTVFGVFLLSLVIGQRLAIAIHELGHVVLGACAGYRTKILQIGPLGVISTAKGLRFCRLDYNLLINGGFTYPSTPLLTHERLRNALMVLGGPLASILWVGVLTSIHLTSADVPSWIIVTQNALKLTAAIVACASLIPIQIGPTISDMARLLLIATRGFLYKQHSVLLQLFDQFHEDDRQQTFSQERISQLLTLTQGSTLESYAHCIACFHALAHKQVDQAALYLEQSLKTIHALTTLPSQKSAVALLAAHFEIEHSKDATRAATWLTVYQQHATKLVFNPFWLPDTTFSIEMEQYYLQLQAAVFLAQEKYTAAHTKVLESLAILEKIALWKDVTPNRKYLHELQAKIECALLQERGAITEMQRASKLNLIRLILFNTAPSLPATLAFAFLGSSVMGWDLYAAVQAVPYISEGRVHIKQEQYTLAVDAFSAAVDLVPGMTAVYQQRGIAYLKQQEYARAIDDFTQVIEYSPIREVQSTSLPGGTMTYWLRSYEKEIVNSSRMEMIMAYVARGAAYYQLDELEAALADFQTVATLAPDAQDRNRINQLIARAYLEGGIDFYEAQEYSLAILLLTKAIALEPDQANAYWYRGAAFAWLGAYGQAASDYELAVAYLPEKEPRLYRFRADTYVQLNRYSEAIADYNITILLTPALDPELYFLRGKAYLHLGQYDKAIADLTTAMQNYVDNPWAYLYRGFAYLQLHNYEAGQADLAYVFTTDAGDYLRQFVRTQQRLFAKQGRTEANPLFKKGAAHFCYQPVGGALKAQEVVHQLMLATLCHFLAGRSAM